MGDSFWKGKKILVTGGTGFFGKSLTKKLDEFGAEYFTFGSKEFDFTSSNDAYSAMSTEGIKYDFIFHLAAFQKAADWPMHHTGEQFRINNLIHLNALEAWKRHQPQAKFVGAGSVCGYPGKARQLKEEDFDNGSLHESVYAYGFTKRVLKFGLQAYKDQYKLKGTIPMFATLYGPHDDFDLKTAHVVAALVAKFCNAKRENLPEVEIWGDGTQTRELIYVDDQIEGFMLAAQHYEGDIINVGSGKETSVRELAETVKNVSRYGGDIKYNPKKFVGVQHKVSDISLAKEQFGWTVNNKMHSLEEGLAKTVRWYEENK